MHYSEQMVRQPRLAAASESAGHGLTLWGMQVDNLNIGDNLLSAGEIIRLEAALCTGLVAPITRAGTLVVDGVPTSDCKFAFWSSCVF